jgi:DsbC/DsbD-like thiol-disulfide interchange protein
MRATHRAAILALLSCCVCLTGGEARAQSKKSDAVVKIKAEAGKPDAEGITPVNLTLTIDKGWHIYANPVGQEDLADTATSVSASGSTKVVAVDYPSGKPIMDKVLGTYKVYEDQVKITAKVRRPSDGSAIDLSIKIQACNETKCLVPASVKLSVP